MQSETQGRPSKFQEDSLGIFLHVDLLQAERKYLGEWEMFPW